MATAGAEPPSIQHPGCPPNVGVACAGIFIEDILNAVPIDKYFELFKPGAAGPGGFIRISMNFEAAATTPYHSPGKPLSSPAFHTSSCLEWRTWSFDPCPA